MIDVEQARRDLLDASKRFFVIPALFSRDEVCRYRQGCERFMSGAKRIRQRIITDSVEDYVHPRSHDHLDRTARIYQHFHNHRNDLAGQLFARAARTSSGAGRC
jgi:hypothetical protein